MTQRRIQANQKESLPRGWEHSLNLLVRCVWELRKYRNIRYISCQFKVAQHQSWHLLIMVEIIEIHQNHNFALCVKFLLIQTLLGENTQQNKVVNVDHVAQILWRLQVSVPCLLQYNTKLTWPYELFSSWGKTNQSDQTVLKSEDVKWLWCWQKLFIVRDDVHVQNTVLVFLKKKLNYKYTVYYINHSHWVNPLHGERWFLFLGFFLCICNFQNFYLLFFYFLNFYHF